LQSISLERSMSRRGVVSFVLEHLLVSPPSQETTERVRPFKIENLYRTVVSVTHAPKQQSSHGKRNCLSIPLSLVFFHLVLFQLSILPFSKFSCLPSLPVFPFPIVFLHILHLLPSSSCRGSISRLHRLSSGRGNSVRCLSRL
jgi:hypothetical protein